MKERLRETLTQLMLLPGPSGHEHRVRRAIAAMLDAIGISHRTDRLGNLSATIPGDPDLPSVMIFAHMDQLGLIVRRIEDNGLIRVERLGGIPERALASQAVLLCIGEGKDVPGVIANKSHHATMPEEKYTVVRAADLIIDTGHATRAAAEAAGIQIGTPVVYRPTAIALAHDRIAGTAIDDRAGCAVLLQLAKTLAGRTAGSGATVHLVFSVQEEFNLRGAMVAANRLKPDLAIQIDLMLATDTPDMADRGDMHLGHGPGVSMYNFHGRGTLNGVLPHRSMVRLIENAAAAMNLPLQRSAQVGILTDLAYVQLVGAGVCAIDVGFPMRYSHSSLEMCDLGDLEALSRLLIAAVAMIDRDFQFEPDGDL